MAEAAAMPSLAQATAWVAAPIVEVGGEEVGSVYGFFIDDESDQPAWLIARLGRRRQSRLIAVPLRDCAGTPSGAWVAHEAEALRGAPVVDPGKPLRREHELTICEHFGQSTAVGRAAEVASRAEGAITARPAAAL